MPGVMESAASLRFFGEDLDPEEVTALLGAKATASARTGETWFSPTGFKRVAPCGFWRFTVERRRPGDLDGQIRELLQGLTVDLEVWGDLTRRFRGDLFCGLFLKEGNEGVSLSPATLSMVGLRGLEIDLDIYDTTYVNEPDPRFV